MTGGAPRTAWVTGAAQGIGAGIARHLALAMGMRVALLDRNDHRLRETAALLRAEGAQVETAALDLADGPSIGPASASLAQRFGPAEVLVNNAGIAFAAAAEDYPLDAWERTLAVNLTAPFLLSQACLAAMRTAGWGRIVNIASISGMRAGTGRVAYGTSKAGLIALTQQIAIEAAPWGITANAVAPGMVETELAARMHQPATLAAMLARVPVGRYGLAGEIAAAVGYLASDAAAYVTGHTLAVDGGFVCAGWLLPAGQDS
ncbi:MAG: SDR family oxidoreductase [Ramlibacter sp.]|nr:SDR family oxidoreductase [Ramlibacter sp.]